MKNDPQNSRVPVTLTADQHKTLKLKASMAGLTISAYLRMAALERAAK